MSLKNAGFLRLSEDDEDMRHPSFKFFVVTALACMLTIAPAFGDEQMAHGLVFHDLNSNGKLDSGEPGLEGVKVSNQVQIVSTDADGKWSLPCSDDTTFFVIKPSGYSTPLNKDNLPQFYYIHKPKGSPNFKFPGVSPTGDLPDSINFALEKVKEPKNFQALFFGDPQPRDIREVEYIGYDVVEELIGSKAKFGVTLGDIVFDDLNLFEPLNGSIALIGIPWFNVIGNHDINFDAPNDELSDETFTRVYGPSYYSFDYGPVHFLVLDNIMWGGAKPAGSGSYSGGFGENQIKFIKNDLKDIPSDQLVVLLMHIPITGTADREELFRLIEDRPYTLSISGHTHWQAHLELDKEAGWKGKKPHHHFVCVTVSGSWWTGQPDEFGIPHTSMRDGVPNGYAIIDFSKTKAEISYKAARKPASFQMSIHAPKSVKLSETASIPLMVNVFNGWKKSKVQVRWNNAGKWQSLQFAPDARDNFLTEAKSREPESVAPPFRKLSGPVSTYHIWTGDLLDIPAPGVHKISVRATDVNGNWLKSSRIIRIE